MNCQKRTLSFLFSIMTLSACGGLDGTTSVDDGAFGEAGLETMEQALSRESAEGQGLAAAIPAKGALACAQSQTIHINGTENEQRCEVDYENTCGRSSNLFSNGTRLDLAETINNNTASVSFVVPAGKHLIMNCCLSNDKDKYCRYEITGCVTLEADDDAK